MLGMDCCDVVRVIGRASVHLHVLQSDHAKNGNYNQHCLLSIGLMQQGLSCTLCFTGVPADARYQLGVS